MKEDGVISCLFDGGKTQRSLSLGLVTLGLLLMIATVALGPVIDIDPENSLGIFSEIPLTYVAALILVFVGMVFAFTLSSDRYFYFGVVVMTLLVWNTVTFIEPYPRFWDAYRHFIVPYSMTDGSLDTFTMARMFRKDFYLDWPLSYHLTALALNSLGVEGQEGTIRFLQFFPLFASLGSLGFWIIFARRVFEPQRAKLCVALLFTLNVYFQFHYSPHAFGLMILPIFLLTLTYKQSMGSFLCFALVWVLLLGTHLLTMLVAATLVITMLITGNERVMEFLRFRFAKGARKPFKITYLHGVFLLGSALIYHLLFAQTLFDLLRNRFISFEMVSAQGLHLGNMSTPVFASSFSDLINLPYLGHPASNMRLAVFLTCGILSLAVIFFMRKRWEQRLSLALGFMVTAAGFSYLFFVSPTLNLSDRIPLYQLISISIFASMALVPLKEHKRRQVADEENEKRAVKKSEKQKQPGKTYKGRWLPKVLVLMVLIMLAAMNSSTLYYQEAFNTISPESKRGYDYVNSDDYENGIAVMRTNLFSIEFILYPDNNLVPRRSFENLDMKQLKLMESKHPHVRSEIVADPDMGRNILLPVDPEIRDRLFLIDKEDKYNRMLDFFEERVTWHKIYDSGEFKVYVFMRV